MKMQTLYRLPLCGLVLALAGTLSACNDETPAPGPAAPSIGSFTITPATITAGTADPANAAVLKWSGVTNVPTTAGAKPCKVTVSPDSGTGPFAGGVDEPSSSTGVSTGPMPTAGAYSYKLTCTGEGGTSFVTKILTVTAPTTPTVTLNLTKSAVNTGETTQLTWTTSNVTACKASGSWSGAKALNSTPPGEDTVASATATYQYYNLVCTNAAGQAASASATLKIGDGGTKPVVNVIVLPDSIAAGSAGKIIWDSVNTVDPTPTAPVQPCTPSGNGSVLTDSWKAGTKLYNSSYGAGSPAPRATAYDLKPATVPGTYTFTLTCNNADSSQSGTATATLTVTGTVATAKDCGIEGKTTRLLLAPELDSVDGGTACPPIPGLCSVDTPEALSTESLDDFAKLSILLGVGTPIGSALTLNSTVSIAAHASNNEAAGTRIGFLVSSPDKPSLNVGLLNNLTLRTLDASNNEVEVSAASTSTPALGALTLDLANLLLSVKPEYYVSFTTTKPFRGVQLDFNNSVAGAVTNLQVYGACVDLTPITP